jgi:acid phosphatase family membrane protein YuiD
MFVVISVRSESFRTFFENPVFLSSVSSWFLAQVVKTAIVVLRGNRKSRRELLETIAWRTGGMPSSHSALVSAMAVSIGLRDGFGSDLFVIALFVALIVMRDAMGVRRSSGIQARMLNLLGRRLEERMHMEFHPVKEVHGHAPLEVVIGALLGIFIAAAYRFL